MTGKQGLKILKTHKGYKGSEYDWLVSRCNYYYNRELPKEIVANICEFIN